jgi:GNAT superfamily N-acetyltransferase
MLDDPTSLPVYRRSGNPPYPSALSPLPSEITPRQVTLRDRVTTATLFPFSSPHEVPPSLLSYLCDQFNREIEKGDTYPMIDSLPLEKFGPYWFANFGAAMLLGNYENTEDIARVDEETNWEKNCLGSFYIKPNYPGRSSHVCNGGFLVTDAARNRGVGRLMGEGYLEWAPKLVRVRGVLQEMSVMAGSSLTRIIGIYVFRFQPRLRDKCCIVPDLGCSRIQTNWARQRLWKSTLLPGRAHRRNHIWSRFRS